MTKYRMLSSMRRDRRYIAGLAIVICFIAWGCAGKTIFTNTVGTPLSQARDRLKALDEAFVLYVSDNDDGTPLAANWMDSLAAYTDATNFLAPGVGDAANGIYGFAYNEVVAQRRMHEFPDRSIVPLFFDSTNTVKNATSNLGTLPVPGRYDGENAVSFLDGFVEGYDILEESMRRLKQLGMAALIYGADHDDRYPGAGWIDDIRPFTSQSRLFRAPLFDSEPTKYGFALNSAIAGVRGQEVQDVEGTLLIFDSTNLEKSAVEPTSTLPKPGRYGGYNTGCYADSHARFFF